MKKALILNISYNDINLMKSLKKMGYYVYAIGKYSGLHGEKYADKYIQFDYSDQDGVLQLAKELKVDAICSCVNDTGVITAAYVAEQLGLKGHDTYNNALIIQHKDKFNRFLHENGIQEMYTADFMSEEDAIEQIKQYDENSYPYIVKPIDLCGGVGITRIDNLEEGILAIRNAFSLSRQKHIVIEKFIEGKQYGLCTFLVDQRVVYYCHNNEVSFINPYYVEIDMFPSDCKKTTIDELIEKINKIARMLKLSDGIFHIQFIENEGRPHIIEAMRRVPGNLYTKLDYQINAFDWDYWEARSHCGINVGDEIAALNIKDNGKNCAYRSILAKENGIFKEVIIPADLEVRMFGKMFSYEPGTEIEDYTRDQIELDFFEFDSYDEMYKNMVERYDEIKVIMEK